MADGLGEAGDDALVGVPDDQRPIAGNVINIGIAIDVLDEAALARLDEDGNPPTALKWRTGDDTPPGISRHAFFKVICEPATERSGWVGMGFAFQLIRNLRNRCGQPQCHC